MSYTSYLILLFSRNVALSGDKDKDIKKRLYNFNVVSSCSKSRHFNCLLSYTKDSVLEILPPLGPKFCSIIVSLERNTELLWPLFVKWFCGASY